MCRFRVNVSPTSIFPEVKLYFVCVFIFFVCRFLSILSFGSFGGGTGWLVSGWGGPRVCSSTTEEHGVAQAGC